MVYDNQLYEPLHVGDRRRGYVSQVTDERRIDIMLRQQGYDEVISSAVRLVELAKQNNNILPLSDSSSPEEIKEMAHMSKKVFKKAVGYLMRHGLTNQTESGLEITGEVEQQEPKSAPTPPAKSTPKEPLSAPKESRVRPARPERNSKPQKRAETPVITQKKRTEREGKHHAYTKFLRTKGN